MALKIEEISPKLKEIVPLLNTEELECLKYIIPDKYLDQGFISCKVLNDKFLKLDMNDYISDRVIHDNRQVVTINETIFGRISSAISYFKSNKDIEEHLIHYLNIFKLLLKRGANPTIANNQGIPPIVYLIDFVCHKTITIDDNVRSSLEKIMNGIVKRMNLKDIFYDMSHKKMTLLDLIIEKRLFLEFDPIFFSITHQIESELKFVPVIQDKETHDILDYSYRYKAHELLLWSALNARGIFEYTEHQMNRLISELRFNIINKKEAEYVITYRKNLVTSLKKIMHSLKLKLNQLQRLSVNTQRNLTAFHDPLRLQNLPISNRAVMQPYTFMYNESTIKNIQEPSRISIPEMPLSEFINKYEYLFGNWHDVLTMSNINLPMTLANKTVGEINAQFSHAFVNDLFIEDVIIVSGIKIISKQTLLGFLCRKLFMQSIFKDIDIVQIANYLFIIKSLLEFGANPNLADGNGILPIIYLESFRYQSGIPISALYVNIIQLIIDSMYLKDAIRTLDSEKVTVLDMVLESPYLFNDTTLSQIVSRIEKELVTTEVATSEIRMEAIHSLFDRDTASIIFEYSKPSIFDYSVKYCSLDKQISLVPYLKSISQEDLFKAKSEYEISKIEDEISLNRQVNSGDSFKNYLLAHFIEINTLQLDCALLESKIANLQNESALSSNLVKAEILPPLVFMQRSKQQKSSEKSSSSKMTKINIQF